MASVYPIPWTKNSKKRNCFYCNKKFMAPKPRGHNSPRRFCSRSCEVVEWQSRHGWQTSLVAYEEVKRKRKVPPKISRCMACGESFKVVRHNPRHKYCSRKCFSSTEYFLRAYGDNWQLAKTAFEVRKHIAAFRREVKDAG